MLKKILFSLIIVVGLVSCEVPVHEEYDLYGDHTGDGDGGGEDVVSVFKAKVDGVLFEPSIKEASIIGGKINVSGINSEGKLITITVSGTTTGTYNFNFDEGETTNFNALAYKENEAATESYVATNIDESSTGSITISEINTTSKLISGTFEAVAFTGSGEESVTISEGVFSNVSYTTELPDSGTNEFFAKVDEVEFVENSIQAIEVTLGGRTSISINATRSDMAVIGLNIPIGSSSPGTYEFSSFPMTGDEIIGQYVLSDTEIYSANEGSLTITAHDETANTISGTFFFTAKPMTSDTPTFAITEGSFSVSY